jgi:hypothetical protein
MVCKRRTKAVVIAEKLAEAIKGGKYDVGGKLPSVCADETFWSVERDCGQRILHA